MEILHNQRCDKETPIWRPPVCVGYAPMGPLQGVGSLFWAVYIHRAPHRASSGVHTPRWWGLSLPHWRRPLTWAFPGFGDGSGLGSPSRAIGDWCQDADVGMRSNNNEGPKQSTSHLLSLLRRLAWDRYKRRWRHTRLAKMKACNQHTIMNIYTSPSTFWYCRLYHHL